LNLLFARGASVVQYLSVRGKHPAPLPITANYEPIKTRAGRLSRARVICGGAKPPLAETIPGRLAAARA